MKKALALIVALMFVTAANATIEFFYTHGTLDPWGMSGLDANGDPVAGFNPLLHQSVPGPGPGGTYYYGDGYTLRDIGVTGATPAAQADDVPTAADLDPVVTLGPGEFANIWVRFSAEEITATDNKITGIQDFTVMVGGSTTGVNLVGYQLRAIGRWQLVADADYYKNPLNLVAVTSPSIANVASSDRNNLYIGLSAANYRRTALLGAVYFDAGVVGAASNTIANMFTFGYTEPRVTQFLNGVQAVPEPASLLLLGLAGLVLRRR